MRKSKSAAQRSEKTTSTSHCILPAPSKNTPPVDGVIDDADFDFSKHTPAFYTASNAFTLIRDRELRRKITHHEEVSERRVANETLMDLYLMRVCTELQNQTKPPMSNYEKIQRELKGLDELSGATDDEDNLNRILRTDIKQFLASSRELDITLNLTTEKLLLAAEKNRQRSKLALLQSAQNKNQCIVPNTGTRTATRQGARLLPHQYIAPRGSEMKKAEHIDVANLNLNLLSVAVKDGNAFPQEATSSPGQEATSSSLYDLPQEKEQSSSEDDFEVNTDLHRPKFRTRGDCALESSKFPLLPFLVPIQIEIESLRDQVLEGGENVDHLLDQQGSTFAHAQLNYLLATIPNYFNESHGENTTLWHAVGKALDAANYTTQQLSSMLQHAKNMQWNLRTVYKVLAERIGHWLPPRSRVMKAVAAHPQWESLNFPSEILMPEWNSLSSYLFTLLCSPATVEFYKDSFSTMNWVAVERLLCRMRAVEEKTELQLVLPKRAAKLLQYRPSCWHLQRYERQAMLAHDCLTTISEQFLRTSISSSSTVNPSNPILNPDSLRLLSSPKNCKFSPSAKKIDQVNPVKHWGPLYN